MVPLWLVSSHCPELPGPRGPTASLVYIMPEPPTTSNYKATTCLGKAFSRLLHQAGPAYLAVQELVATMQPIPGLSHVFVPRLGS